MVKIRHAGQAGIIAFVRKYTMPLSNRNAGDAPGLRIGENP
jgi:hypothetical protein